MLRGPLRGAEKLGMLPTPHRRQRLEQIIELQRGRLPAGDDCFDDFRSEQGQPQDATDVGVVDLLRLGEFCGRRVFSVLQHFAPAVGAHDGFEQGMIDAR
jgi:hypothetical protein